MSVMDEYAPDRLMECLREHIKSDGAVLSLLIDYRRDAYTAGSEDAWKKISEFVDINREVLADG